MSLKTLCPFQLEVHKPLVNLVDNMVTMGSLYGGDNLMFASQYKRVGLQPNIKSHCVVGWCNKMFFCSTSCDRTSSRSRRR